MTFPHGVHRKEYCYEEGRFDVKQVGMGIPNRIVPLSSVLAAHHKFYTAAKPNGPDIFVFAFCACNPRSQSRGSLHSLLSCSPHMNESATGSVCVEIPFPGLLSAGTAKIPRIVTNTWLERRLYQRQ